METFGPFVLLEKIAEGGMAVTYLARNADDPPGGEFVCKRILPRLADDPELRALFLDESRVAARLDHPNVVKTFGFGDVDGEFWIAMEHIWGMDLRRVVERGQGVGKFIPMRLAVDLVARAARGLHHAHNLHDDKAQPIGLVHRDISPPNVMLGFDGAVKLVDFGIARAESRYLQSRSGQLKGKFGYMSPEQVQGLEIDHRSDIFSLGIVLYELTTRTRLFRAESDVMTIKLVSEAHVEPPHRLRADFPPRLSEIVMRALAADPADRFESAAEFADALTVYLKESRQEPTPRHLADYLGEIFPDRIEELNELTGRQYIGAQRRPTLPEPPRPAPVAVQPAPPAPAPVTATASRPAVRYEPATDQDDAFMRTQKSSRALLAVFGVAVLVAVGLVVFTMVTRGAGTSYMDGVDVGVARSDFDAVLAPPPEAPPTAEVPIQSDPPGAWVVVNGVAVRQRTPTSAALVIGQTNTVALHLDGHATQYVTVDAVAESGNAPVSGTLAPIVQPPNWTPPPADPATPDAAPVAWSIPRGRIRVEATSPAGPLEGAEVLRNGELVPGGTPVEFEVDAGQDQHITVRLAGYRDAVGVVRAMPWGDETDTRVLSLELPAAQDDANAQFTTLRIATTPRDTTVTLDGEDLGAVNLRTLDSPLHYVVEISAPDHEPFVRAFDARPGQIELNALLTPIVIGPAQVSITAEPAGTQIFAALQRHGAPGARPLGTDVVAGREMEAGRYLITLSNEQGDARLRGRTEIELLPQMHHTFVLRLEAGEVVVVEQSSEPVVAP